MVDATTAAVTCCPAQHIGRLPQATVTYDGAPARRIGGPDAVARLLDVGTVLAAVELVAYAEVALQLTVDHVAERVQFGRPLGAFQAVQHQCADMATLLEAARFLVYETVWKVAHGEASATEIAVAKAAASRAGSLRDMQAHQLHGGIGMTEEYPLQFFSRRAQARAVAWMSQHDGAARSGADGRRGRAMGVTTHPSTGGGPMSFVDYEVDRARRRDPAQPPGPAQRHVARDARRPDRGVPRLQRRPRRVGRDPHRHRPGLLRRPGPEGAGRRLRPRRGEDDGPRLHAPRTTCSGCPTRTSRSSPR